MSTRNEIIELLKSVKRDGTQELIEALDEVGFFTAPSSTKYHGAKEGGLAEHSLNVYECAKKIASGIYQDVDADSMIICTLLHDIGKCGQFGKPNYVEKVLKSGKPARDPYVTNKELLYVDHEVRSVQIIQRYMDLTEEENWAILMHNGLYGSFKYQIQGKETPLYMLLHFSDMWAARVIEAEEEE